MLSRGGRLGPVRERVAVAALAGRPASGHGPPVALEVVGLRPDSDDRAVGSGGGPINGVRPHALAIPVLRNPAGWLRSRGSGIRGSVAGTHQSEVVLRRQMEGPVESDPTRMCELLVGLPDVRVIGIDDGVALEASPVHLPTWHRPHYYRTHVRYWKVSQW